MKKHLVKVIAILTSISTLVMANCGSEISSVKAMDELISLEDIDVTFCETQKESIDQYRHMLATFNEAAERRTSVGQVYDSNYGGAYIDEDGELVVLLVNCDQANINDMKVATKNNNLIVEKCQYAFNELIVVIEVINENLDYLTDCGIIVTEMYEDIYNNRVKIGIKDLTNDKLAILQNVIDSPCMEVYSHDVSDKEEVSIRGGYKITNSNNGGEATLGFCAVRGGNTYGFVIAGHSAKDLYENFTYNGTTIGYSTATAFYNYSSADAAFLTKSSTANTTAYIDIYKCHEVGDDISDFPVGAVIYKYGIATNLTSGTIQSNYYTSYAADDDGDDSNNYYFTLQTTASYDSEQGDSGGPVFMITDVINGSVTCKLLGIHRGSQMTGNQYAIFSKYYKIVDELGISAICE